MIGLCAKPEFNEHLGKKLYKVRTSAQNNKSIQLKLWAKYGVFKALYLMIEGSYHLFDTFPTQIKDKTLYD